MTRDPSTRRRRFLQSAGLGSVALIAGCSALDSSQDGNETDGEDGSDGSPSGEQRTVGFSVSLNQEEQLQIQSISQQLQNEELTQEEATEAQTDVIQGAIDSLVSELEGVSNVAVDEELADLSAVRLTGAPAELIDALELDRAQSMVSEADLDSALSQSQG